MRIVFIITGLSAGGAEMMLVKILEHLDRSRFSTHVISLTAGGELASHIAALGIPVESLNLNPSFSSISAIFRLKRMLKNLRPDVVHTWMYHSDFIGGLAAKLAGIRAIIWCIRNSNLDEKKTNFSTRAIVSLCAALSTTIPVKIISCSEKARTIHVDQGYSANKFQVIPNGFDLSKFKPDEEARISVRRELGLGPDTPIVGLIGRFDPQKNHEGFFEAAAYLHQWMPEANFLLAGKWVDAENPVLRKAMQKAGVSSRTHLLGMRNDIPRIMASLDTLVSSSSYGEAFPNVLGEAMACGIPCIATDIGDSAYIVGSTGEIIPREDTKALAYAMLKILQLPTESKLELRSATRARISTHFEIHKITQQYEAAYDELVRASGEKDKAHLT